MIQLPDQGWFKQITTYSLDWVQEIADECLFRNKLKMYLDLEAASLDWALENLCSSLVVRRPAGDFVQVPLAMMPPHLLKSHKNPTGP